MKTKAKKPTYPSRSGDVPVTQRMLYVVRDELKSDIRQLDSKLSGRIDSLEGKVKALFHELMSQIHQMKILVEEQNARNIIVMDGLVNLFERQDRIEAKVDKI